MDTSPTTATTPHHFLLPTDDDDGDTASQRSISLSSPPASARSSMKPSAYDYSKRVSRPYTLDTDFSSEGPDDVSLNSGKLAKDSADTSAPSSPKGYSASASPPEATTVRPTYPPQRSSDAQSVAESFASGSSRKARPESMLITPPEGPLVLGIALVDFNHLVGPRIEYSKKPIFEDEEVTKILPFLALPDGAHLSAEDYTYFHLVPSGPKPTTIFGISCNQQIAASALLVKDPDVTRSTVQKAVVVLASKPLFGPIRDKLGVVTTALFHQRDFSETRILYDFEEALEPSLRTQLTESGLYMGTNLRDLVHTFRQRTLVLVKALILQKRIIFYGHPVERLCTSQYSLVSLLPGLLQTLDDSGSPPLNARAPTLSRPSSLRTSDHKSMMAYLGLPLDIFGKDAFFQPYLPLQQLDMLKESRSWLCGTTNSIVTQQKEIDLLVNMETGVFEFRDPKLERSVGLTPADRKWMDDIVKDVNEGWDNEDPGRVAGIQFKGSDDYLRTKFEEYISAALASVRYRDFLAKGEGAGVIISGGTGNEANSIEDFNPLWLSEFKQTNAYDVWERITDPMLFDIVEPRHPCVDKPSVVSDIGLRLSEGIQDLKLEQQFAPAREAVAQTWKTGSANFLKAVEGVKGRWAAAGQTPATEIAPATVEIVTPQAAASSTPATPVRASVQSFFGRRFSNTSTSSNEQQQAPAPPEKDQPPPSPAPVSKGSWAAGIGGFWNRQRTSTSQTPSKEEEATPATAPIAKPANGESSSDLSVVSSPSVEIIDSESPLFAMPTSSSVASKATPELAPSPPSEKSASSPPAAPRSAPGLRSFGLRADAPSASTPASGAGMDSRSLNKNATPPKSPVLRSFTLSAAPVKVAPLDVSRPKSPRIPTSRGTSSSPMPLRRSTASPVSADGRLSSSPMVSTEEKRSPSPLTVNTNMSNAPVFQKVEVESPESANFSPVELNLKLSPPISPVQKKKTEKVENKSLDSPVNEEDAYAGMAM